MKTAEGKQLVPIAYGYLFWFRHHLAIKESGCFR